MKEDIINRIRSRIVADKGSIPFPPASEDAVIEVESSLGFKIPPLLRLIYLDVSNGGFGPAYGIIGVDGGRASNLGTLAKAFTQMKLGSDYLGLEWKTGLLPFCEWGCNIFSCVDCNDPGHRVFQSETCQIFETSFTLEKFFELWLDDANLLDTRSLRRKTVEIINPFTGEKTRVSGTRKKSK